MIQSVIPQLRMTDAKRSLHFYIEILGFELDWTHQFEPGFPLFVQLTRRGQTIFLTEHSGDCQVGGAVYFVLEGIDTYYQDLLSRGCQTATVPEDTPWGTREFLVADPDGNRLRWASSSEI